MVAYIIPPVIGVVVISPSSNIAGFVNVFIPNQTLSALRTPPAAALIANASRYFLLTTRLSSSVPDPVTPTYKLFAPISISFVKVIILLYNNMNDYYFTIFTKNHLLDIVNLTN